jgi:putative ABC transport system permease protein
MTPLTISLKNLIRRKSRSFFIVMAMVIASASFVAVKTYSDVMKMSITHRMEKYGANIIITPGSDVLDLPYNGLDMAPFSIAGEEISEKDFERIKYIKNYANIAAAGASVSGITAISGKRVVLTGIDFSKLYILRPWWDLAGIEPKPGGVIAGATAASVLGISQGDMIKVKGRSLTVEGILEKTGSGDDNIIFTDLKNAQMILNKEGRLSMIEIAALCSGCPIEEMVLQLTGVFPQADVRGIKQVIDSRSEYIDQVESMIYGILSVLLIICGLVVLTTMMNNIRERSGEIGIFRAIGFTRAHIIKMIISEALLLSSLAGITGYAAGMLSVYLWGIFVPAGEDFIVHFNITTLFLAMLITMATGISAGIYPAIAASRLDPVQALRHV